MTGLVTTILDFIRVTLAVIVVYMVILMVAQAYLMTRKD